MISRLRTWTARHERFLWAGLIVVVLSVQWPTLKGFYYRAADVSPPLTSVQWRTDVAAALLEAQRTDKAVLVDFSADWCPPCIVMKHDVWPDPAVERALAQSYVPVLIDVDTEGEVPERYAVQHEAHAPQMARQARPAASQAESHDAHVADRRQQQDGGEDEGHHAARDGAKREYDRYRQRGNIDDVSP